MFQIFILPRLIIEVTEVNWDLMIQSRVSPCIGFKALGTIFPLICTPPSPSSRTLELTIEHYSKLGGAYKSVSKLEK